MKSIVTILFPLCLGSAGALPPGGHNQTFDDVIYSGLVVSSDYSTKLPDEDAKHSFKLWLAQYPDAFDRLMTLIERDFSNTGNTEHIRFPLAAMAILDDLNQDQLDRLTAPLERLGGEIGREWSGVEIQYISGAFRVLAKYPSPRHEQLAVRFLKDPDTLMAYHAVNTLASIGSAASLPLVQDLIETRKRNSAGYFDYERDLMIQALARFQQRIAGETSDVKPRSQGAVAPHLEIHTRAAKEDAETEHAEEPFSGRHAAWGAVAFGIMGMLWLLLKKRRR